MDVLLHKHRIIKKNQYYYLIYSPFKKFSCPDNAQNKVKGDRVVYSFW